MKKILRFFSTRRGWAYFLFWSWNIIFLAFMAFGFAPTILPEMQQAVEAGNVPAAFLVYAAALTAIPVVAVILGATVFRQAPFRLFAFGYVVEGPLMLLLALRFFVVRQATPTVTLLLLMAAVGVIVFLWVLIDQRLDDRPTTLSGLRLLGLTLLLLSGIYVSIWVGFYAVPLGVTAVENVDDMVRGIGQSIRNFSWSNIDWRAVPLTLLGLPLLLYSGTLFVLMPLVVTYFCVRAWGRSLIQMGRRAGVWAAAGIPLATAALVALSLWATMRQPQLTAFDLLQTPPTSTAELNTLMDQEAVIRAGLLNAYLAPHRYISSVGEVDHIRRIYKEVVRVDDATAARVQDAYETMARPLLYQPAEPLPADQISWQNNTFTQEPVRAAALYQQYFDEPLIDGEREAVVEAVRSTWSVDQAITAWQAVDDREVWLQEQAVTITENGDWAEVELYEVYQNQTAQRQEVIYYFSLPESAVITGVWLGNSAEREERFAYRVAPRGAAQQVYQEQVVRRVDPALVEQIGPSQYRLRIFPVLPMVWQHNPAGGNNLVDAPPLHMWLTYRVLIADGGWPLPYMSEKLNVYWTPDSARTLNGAPLTLDDETWLPDQAAAIKPMPPQPHVVPFPDGTTIVGRPVVAADLATPADNLKLAVVLDRSRSMVDLGDEVAAALAEIDAWGTADVYLTSSEFRGEAPSRTTLAELNPAEIVYFGGQNPGELLTQFGALYQNEPYDAVLVLTDGSGYELGEAQTPIPAFEMPLWMVHLNGAYPIGYTDDHLAAIQGSGGGSAGSVQEALQRLAAGDEIDIVDGFVWSVDVPPPGLAINHAAADPFAALAARQLILHEMAVNQATLNELETLDALHALAVEQSIITPYSSMIVLVSKTQERRLDQLEDDEDRFEREFEAVGETGAPVPITGVPEPHEWLLIALGVGMLMWLYRRERADWRLET